MGKVFNRGIFNQYKKIMPRTTAMELWKMRALKTESMPFKFAPEERRTRSNKPRGHRVAPVNTSERKAGGLFSGCRMT